MIKPLYTLQIDVIAASFEVLINGIPIDEPSDGSAVAFEMPINHLLKSIRNVVEVRISPSKVHNEYVAHTKTSFGIYEREIDELRDNRKLINEVPFPDYKNDPELKYLPITSSQTFVADIIKDPLWIAAPPLTMNQGLVSGATEVYKRFHKALKERNLDDLLRLIKYKDQHYADSYYLSYGEQQNDSRNAFLKALNKPDNVLIEYDIQTIMPYLFASDKLISLKNDDNRSPLMFYNTETDITTSFVVYLCLVGNEMCVVL